MKLRDGRCRSMSVKPATAERLRAPLRPVQLARQANRAASSAADSAPRAWSRASTLTPLPTGRSMMVVGVSRIEPGAEMTRLARRRAPGAPTAIDTTGPQWRGTPGAPEPLASLGQFYPDAELVALASQAGLQDVQVRNDGGGPALTARS